MLPSEIWRLIVGGDPVRRQPASRLDLLPSLLEPRHIQGPEASLSTATWRARASPCIIVSEEGAGFPALAHVGILVG